MVKEALVFVFQPEVQVWLWTHTAKLPQSHTTAAGGISVDVVCFEDIVSVSYRASGS